jgi:L-alanine-DL-glutamate epimerase-like enolase superfamily enzyme
MKFGGRVVQDVTLVHVRIEAETRNGRRATGYGSMPMGNVWAWPSLALSSDKTLAAMVELARRSVAEATACQLTDDPLALTRALAEDRAAVARKVAQQHQLQTEIPVLAQLVAASPLEAAIHDAFGWAQAANSYNLLSAEFVNHDLSDYLGPDFRGEYLDRYTLRRPKPQMPLYHLVGALDPLTHLDVSQPVGDGLPETLDQWIVADGLTHLKIKLNGDDIDWDVRRVIEVDRVSEEAQRARGCVSWRYSLDFNERCPNVAYVLDFLQRIQQDRVSAWDRIQYIEQPTNRDLRANPENRMHQASALKPVVIDESLTDLDSLMLSREMGYSGVALKACKGHTEALLMGAAAQKHGLFLCVQDLTCPGASFLHSASLACRIPTVAALEGNARQYCPQGNRGWSARYPQMFDIRNGTLGTAVLDQPGLGFSWGDHAWLP